MMYVNIIMLDIDINFLEVFHYRTQCHPNDIYNNSNIIITYFCTIVIELNKANEALSIFVNKQNQKLLHCEIILIFVGQCSCIINFFLVGWNVIS